MPEAEVRFASREEYEFLREVRDRHGVMWRGMLLQGARQVEGYDLRKALLQLDPVFHEPKLDSRPLPSKEPPRSDGGNRSHPPRTGASRGNGLEGIEHKHTGGGREPPDSDGSEIGDDRSQQNGSTELTVDVSGLTPTLRREPRTEQQHSSRGHRVSRETSANDGQHGRNHSSPRQASEIDPSSEEIETVDESPGRLSAAEEAQSSPGGAGEPAYEFDALDAHAREGEDR